MESNHCFRVCWMGSCSKYQINQSDEFDCLPAGFGFEPNNFALRAKCFPCRVCGNRSLSK